jgi:hypothetical protein
MYRFSAAPSAGAVGTSIERTLTAVDAASAAHQIAEELQSDTLVFGHVGSNDLIVLRSAAVQYVRVAASDPDADDLSMPVRPNAVVTFR